MRIGRGHLVTRVLGVCTGVGFLALGLFALTGGQQLDGSAGDRALGFGVALVVAGIAAIVGSLTVVDPSRIW
jgi:hypothetical protein